MLTYEELLKADPKKLSEELEIAQRDLFKVRLEVRTGQSKSNHLVGNAKKYIAQIKTVLKLKNNEV